MTSIGDISAASTTTAAGFEMSLEEGIEGAFDLRNDLTTSFTPRLRVFALAAVQQS